MSNINIGKGLKGNIRIKQTVRSDSVPVKHQFYVQYPKEYYIELNKPKNVQYDIIQFKKDISMDFSLADKNIFLESTRAAENEDSKQLFGAGTVYRREREKKPKNISDEMTMTISKRNGNSNKEFFKKCKAVPVEMNQNSQYLVLLHKGNKKFEAFPVKQWYKMQSFVEKGIDEELVNLRDFSLEEKIYNKYQPTENKTNNLNDLTKQSDEEQLSDVEKQEKEKCMKRKKAAYLRKMRYGKKEYNQNEDSDQGDHEGEEIDYMTSDSSMNEDKLSEGERALIYENVDVVEEENVGRKVTGMVNEEELEEENSKNIVDKKKEDVMEDEEEEDCDDDDDDSDMSDSDSDDLNFFDDNNRKRARLSDEDTNNSDPKHIKLIDKRMLLSEEMQKLMLEKRKMKLKDLFAHFIQKKLLVQDTESKKLFFDTADRLGLRIVNIDGEKYYML